MIQLHLLTSASRNAEWQEPRGVINGVHHELQPGVFLHITLGAAGVVIRHDKEQVGIPLEELVKLARVHNPKIGQVEPAPVPVGRDSGEPK